MRGAWHLASVERAKDAFGGGMRAEFDEAVAFAETRCLVPDHFGFDNLDVAGECAEGLEQEVFIHPHGEIATPERPNWSAHWRIMFGIFLSCSFRRRRCRLRRRARFLNMLFRILFIDAILSILVVLNFRITPRSLGRVIATTGSLLTTVDVIVLICLVLFGAVIMIIFFFFFFIVIAAVCAARVAIGTG